MGIKVTKFGGSSLANAEQFKKVISILKADADRRYAVPSAPGKRFSGDDKITDLLYKCHDIATAGKSIEQVFDKIRSRYMHIAQELGLDYSPEEELELICRNIRKGKNGITSHRAANILTVLSWRRLWAGISLTRLM